MTAKVLPPTIEGTRIGRLARVCYHQRKRVLVCWIVAFVAITALSQSIKGEFSNKFSGGHSQSQLAQNLLTKNFPARAGDTADAVFKTAQPVNSPESQAAINAADQVLARTPHVTGIQSPFGPGGASQISRTDPDIAYSVIQFNAITQDIPKNDLVTML